MTDQALLNDISAVLGCAPDEALATARRWRAALEHYGDEDKWIDPGEDGGDLRWYVGSVDHAGYELARAALGQATPTQDGGVGERDG